MGAFAVSPEKGEVEWLNGLLSFSRNFETISFLFIFPTPLENSNEGMYVSLLSAPNPCEAKTSSPCRAAGAGDLSVRSFRGLPLPSLGEETFGNCEKAPVGPKVWLKNCRT